MNRTWRNYSADMTGHASGLPQIYVGNHMNLNSSNVDNTAPTYGETLHKPAGGPVVERDKKIQLLREISNTTENDINTKRFENNITAPISFKPNDRKSFNRLK